MHLVIGTTLGDPIHKQIVNIKESDIIISFLKTFKSFFYCS